MPSKPLIIVITGPCGVGKTTIVNLLAEELDFSVISGDKLKDELFPQLSIITQFPEKLNSLKQLIFERSREAFQHGDSIIIDYVILGKSYIETYQKEFGTNLLFKVLFPSIKVALERDSKRDCWTSGREVIEHLYERFGSLKEIIGAENYLDTSGKSALETSKILLQEINNLPNS